MGYATVTELATYLGVGGGTLPADASRLLERAGDLVKLATLNRGNVADVEQKTALRDATCAQVEFWLSVGEDHAVTGESGGVSIGSLRIDSLPQQLALRAWNYLFLVGLTFRGVPMGPREVN